MMITYYIIVLSLLRLIKCGFSPYIVGGIRADIQDFPHSAFLGIACDKKEVNNKRYICGASIINEWTLLSAAHCVAACLGNTVISVSTGNANKYDGLRSSVVLFLIHENYDNETFINDITLMKLKTKLNFDSGTKRVTLMNNPPYDEPAQVAGWGRYEEGLKRGSTFLYYIDQNVISNQRCRRRILSLKSGTICGENSDKQSYVHFGDSGSALVVRGYIQIGIVSYKVPQVSRSLSVYTDTGYFYQWIRTTIKKLHRYTNSTVNKVNIE